MKAIKRTLAVALAAILLFSMCGVAFAENWIQLPTEDSDALSEDDLWFDVDGFLRFMGGMSYDLESAYRRYEYWLSADGKTLELRSEGIPVEEYDRDDLAQFWYFDYVLPHGETYPEWETLLTKDSDDLKVGALWLDLSEFLNEYRHYLTDFSDMTHPEIEEILDMYQYLDYYQIADHGKLLRTVNGTEINVYGFTDGDFSVLFDSLRMHGLHKIPTKDSESLSYGDWWFDLESMLRFNQKMNEHFQLETETEAIDAVKTWGFFTNDDGTVIGIRDHDGAFSIYTEEPELPLFPFLRQHGIDPKAGFFKLPVTTENLQEGDWWFDLQGFLAAYEAPWEFDTEEWYLSRNHNTVLVYLLDYAPYKFNRDDDALHIFDYVKQYVPCTHSPVVLPGKPATCTEDGLTEGSKCSICGEILVEQRVIPKLGHNVITLKELPATCTQSGLTEGQKCTVCGEILSGRTQIPPLEHNWDDGTVTKEATVEAEGEMTFTCKACGATKTESIPKKTEPEFIHTDAVKENPTDVKALPGVTAEELKDLAGKGSLIQKEDGTEPKDNELIGSGMVLKKADGTKKTIIVPGDVSGDGKVTAADARYALRQAVGLDQPKDWAKKAALVNGGDKVTAAAARKILRIAVGLDRATLE